MREKIVLVDGHSILNRAFYGVPDLTNTEGLHTNAVYGFLNILLKILQEEEPQYLAVAFDVHAPTFRHGMYEAYKGTRHAMPEELREQVPLIREVLSSMGVFQVSLEGYEADDILGTFAAKGEATGLDVVIVSGDRDLLQLASAHTMIRIPKTKGGRTVTQNYYDKDVIGEYGLTPPQIIELKALMGDSSDNIPGIPGIGIKTATKILTEYGTIESAHEHVQEIKPNKAREALISQWDLAVLSKKLATIDTDAPVDLPLDAARLGDLFTPEAYAMFKRLEFRRLLTQYAGAQTETRMSAAHAVPIADEKEMKALFARAAGTEGAGLSVLGDRRADASLALVCAALAFSKEESYVFAAEDFGKDILAERIAHLGEEGKDISVWQLKEVLHAAPFAADPGWFDAHLAAYLLDPLASSYAHDVVAPAYGGLQLRSAEEIFGGTKVPPASKMTPEQRQALAGDRALCALASRESLTGALREQGMWELYQEIERPLVWVLAQMERAGVRALPEELAAYGASLQEGLVQLEERIYEEAGETFNIQSPKQLGEILFDRMKLPGGKKTKTGYSTAAEVLEKLAPTVPLVADVLDYRQLAKLKSTYADALAGYIAQDGRIHSTFHQTITATGRLSSADPNLQNIPVRVELGRQIRRVFVPEEGKVFLDADYSQIELRVLAAMSGDEKLIAAYREAKDIHAITAAQVFHVPFDEVTPEMRRSAKAVNFGIVYGISSFGLSRDLQITRQEAAEYIERYYETYPAIRDFLDGLVTAAKEKGYAETLFGRRRPMPELASSNFMQRQFGERVAKNAPIQGTAADIIKIAMLRVHRRLKKETKNSRLLLQVHDELLVEADLFEVETVRRILEEEMTRAADLEVKLEIDMHSGENWYEAK